MSLKPTCVEGVVQAVRGSSGLYPSGGRTKNALVCMEGYESLDLTDLSGVTDYDPAEYVLTAKAGTLVEEAQEMLLEKGQYFPFDPPFSEAGSTLGGMVACGLNGPGAIRYGGLRDFLIGVSFVDGAGNFLKGGGKVVKNAAGFDLPKFLIGSLGRFAVLVELSFKVFPRPRVFQSLRIESKNLSSGIEKMLKIAGTGWEPDALELMSDGTIILRLGGTKKALTERLNKILGELGGNGEVLDEHAARDFWQEATAFSWASDDEILIKVPLPPQRIIEIDSLLHVCAKRRYANAGNVAWLAWPTSDPIVELDEMLAKADLPGLVLRGKAEKANIGSWPKASIMEDVKKAFDPEGKFPPLS